jgi:transposase
LGERVSDEEEQARMKLYKQGLSDDEIARRVGVKRTTIISWRYLRGLAKKHKTKKKKEPGITSRAPANNSGCNIASGATRRHV